MEAGSQDSIRVYVRVRPPTEREQAVCPQPAVTIDKPTSSVFLRGTDAARTFTYDGVLGEDSTQEETFDLVGRGVAASCIAGYNGSVYVYGQTGVGKTYTMSGPVASVQSMQFDERRGLICRTLDCVFKEINRRRAMADSISYLCRCSFLEIYKEQITDLLEPMNTNLQIREDMARGVYVERLSEPAVSSLTEAFRVLCRGLQQRHVGTTHMNERSSRSHAVFTLSVEAAQTRAGVTSTRVARLSLVDLAGSERQGVAMESSGAPHHRERVKEAGAINKSLSTLTNVVMSLSREERSKRRSSTGDGRRGFAHFRDSKLTFLLRDSLGGNSKTVIVANVSPCQACAPETLSTLKFAARAKHIRCAAVRNEEFTGTVDSLMMEVKMLRQRLSDLGGQGFRAQAPMGGAASVAGGTETLVSSDPETVEGSPATSPREEGAEESQALYGRKRIKRLEVLLGAALGRERQVDQRQHQLERLAGFLEDLDFRKVQSFGKLSTECSDHIARVETFSDDEEGRDLSEKLLSFRHLLGNLIPGSGAEPRAAQMSPEEEALLPAGLAEGASGGTAEGLQAAAPAEVDAGTGAPAVHGGLTDSEAGFLHAENRLLRRQLESHPEVARLAAENETLRAQLDMLCPGGSRSRTTGRSRRLDADNMTEAPVAAAPLTSEMLLNCSEGGDDGTLRAWVDVQKMAKEVEALYRAKDGLEGLYQQLFEDEGNGPLQQGLGPKPHAEGSVVDLRVVEEVVQAAQEAQRVAHAIADVQRQVGDRLNTGQSQSLTPRGGGDGDALRVRQALQKVNDLHGTLDLVNSAYNEAYDEFQRLREAYESRLEECQFYEVQCSRLDMHCQQLAERLHGSGTAVRAGMGSFSVAGLSPVPASTSWKQKRSVSLSSLRDVTFWEQRFEELSQLTGIEEAESPPKLLQQQPLQQPQPQQQQPQVFKPSPRTHQQDTSAALSGTGSTSRLQPSEPSRQPLLLGPSTNRMIVSSSLSTLQPPAAPPTSVQAACDQPAFRRVASAPQIPSQGELLMRSAQQVPTPTTAVVTTLTAQEEPHQDHSLFLRPAQAPQEGASHTSLSSTALRQLGDPRNKVHSQQQQTQQPQHVHMPGRRLGSNVANQGAPQSHSVQSRGSRLGAGLRGSSPRGAVTHRPQPVMRGPATARAAAAVASSQRPQSLGVTRQSSLAMSARGH